MSDDTPGVFILLAIATVAIMIAVTAVVLTLLWKIAHWAMERFAAVGVLA